MQLFFEPDRFDHAVQIRWPDISVSSDSTSFSTALVSEKLITVECLDQHVLYF